MTGAHVMSMAFYQGGGGEFTLDPKNLVHPAQNISKDRGQALKSAETNFYELAFTSNKQVPTYIKQVKANFLQQCALERGRETTRIESSVGVNQKHPTQAGYR